MSLNPSELLYTEQGSLKSEHAVAVQLEIGPLIEHLVSSVTCSCASNFSLDAGNMKNAEFPVKVFVGKGIGPIGLIGPIARHHSINSSTP